jgi:hypothetical protein
LPRPSVKKQSLLSSSTQALCKCSYLQFHQVIFSYGNTINTGFSLY